MASYIVTLKNTHLSWGSHRYTDSRGVIYGEGYLPIPLSFAMSNSIHNSNHSQIGIGFNEFYFSTSDGFIDNGILKSSGCCSAGNIYAKNLHVSGNLRGLGDWFRHINASVGDQILVDFISNTNIILEKL